MALFDEQKFQVFLERVKKSNNRKLLDFIKQVGKEYSVKCKDCKQMCFLYQYLQRKTSSKHGIRFGKCSKCIESSRDPFTRKVKDMKKRTKRRNRKGRNNGSVFYDTSEKLKAIFDKQKGLCFYSGEPMKMTSDKTFDPNSMSIERLNEELGYIEGNCVFVRLKFQLATKGVPIDVKKRIVQALKTPIKDAITKNLTKQDFEKIKTHVCMPKARRQMEVAGIPLQQCHQCQKFKEFEHFSKFRDSIRTNCKTCENIYSCARRKTYRGFVMKLVDAARGSAIERGSRKRKRNDNSGDLDENLFDVVVNKILQQNGCCALTGFAFIFEPNSPFQPSIDRLDNSKGYTKDNIQIVISTVNNIGKESYKSQKI